jgi:uncharacterized protein
VVPGARSSRLAGALGDRLKVRVAAPPQDGRANREVCELLAAALGLRPAAVTITAGHASPEKTARVTGCSAARAAAALLGESDAAQ